MKNKIVICDFDDSFTYNIFSTVKEIYQYVPVEVIPKKNLSAFFTSLLKTEVEMTIILGPGPGHPDDYEHLSYILRDLVLKKNLSFFCICLGHQLIWSLFGQTIEHSITPIHGQVQKYELTKKQQSEFELPTFIEVQRYNSLAVKINKNIQDQLENDGWVLLIDKNELVMSKRDNIYTLQFHPESIGTKNSKDFFRYINNFLH